jgi:hypothetical protein
MRATDALRTCPELTLVHVEVLGTYTRLVRGLLKGADVGGDGWLLVVVGGWLWVHTARTHSNFVGLAHADIPPAAVPHPSWRGFITADSKHASGVQCVVEEEGPDPSGARPDSSLLASALRP